MHPNKLFFILVVSIIILSFAIAFLIHYTRKPSYRQPSYYQLSYYQPAPPSIHDIASDEARLRAETRKLYAQAERDEALLKAETARVTLEDIRSIIEHERRH